MIAGATAARDWITSRRIPPPGLRWMVEIQLDVRDAPAPADFNVDTDTRFHIEIYAEEWGVFFCHAGRASWIRVTDVPFVHGRDDHHLLARTPELGKIGDLLRALEREHSLHFSREHARVDTTLGNAETAIRRWVRGL